ncbi:MAG: C-type lectin domain-containing protein, partial [Fuerstiella sp.]
TGLRSGDGGLVSVNVANIDAKAQPAVTTEIKGGAELFASTTMRINAAADSNAEALLGVEKHDDDDTVYGDNQKGINIGVITVAANDSRATVKPVVKIDIGDASLNSDGGITIMADGGQPKNISDDHNFDADIGVEVDDNRIDFREEHGLGYGTVVQYGKNESESLGGLKDSAKYRVIPVNSEIVRLGSVLVTHSQLELRYSETGVTWAEAEELAQIGGGRLGTIGSVAENSAVLAMMTSETEAWIGASDSLVEGQWRWDADTPDGPVFWWFGQPYDGAYANWEEDEPSASGAKYDYAAIRQFSLGIRGQGPAQGKWVAFDDTKTLHYFLVAVPDTNAINLVDDQLTFKQPHYLHGGQPDDAGEFGQDALALSINGYWNDMETQDQLGYVLQKGVDDFTIIDDFIYTFEDAQADAVTKGGTLAEITEGSQQLAILDLLHQKNTARAAEEEVALPNVWLAGSDAVEEGTWKWVNSDTPFWRGGLFGTAVPGAYTHFEPADQVVYHAGVVPIRGLENGGRYLVRQLGDQTIKLVDATAEDSLDRPHLFRGGDVTSEALISIENHGFEAGQAVTYRTARPLQFRSNDVSATDQTIAPQDANRIGSVSLLDEDKEVIYSSPVRNDQWFWLHQTETDDSSPQAFWPISEESTGDQPYHNWNDGEPGNPGVEDSATIYPTGFWSNVRGDTAPPLGYLLERPRFSITEGLYTVAQWQRYPAGYIKNGTWPATITTEEEWLAAREVIGQEDVLLGASDDSDRSEWLWQSWDFSGPENGEKFWDGKS